MSEPVRILSSRELEQLQLQKDRTQTAVDKIDERWDEIMAAAALASDCHKALVKNEVPQSIAWNLVPAMMKYLGRK